MNKVSIIIAAYNEEKTIGECLRSLLTQDYNPLEIIVVDDGSTDKTGEIVKRFGVTYFKFDHRGTAISRNYGVEKSTGDIVVFLDADMEFSPDFITKLVEPINQGLTKGTYSRLEYVKNWNNPLARCWNRMNPQLKDKLRISQDQEEGDDFRAILKSEFLRIGGFDDIGYTDTWTLRKKLGYRPQNAPDAVYYHKNPETYREVYSSAKWIGKREYKLGSVGKIVTIFRSFILFSITKGIYQSFKNKDLHHLPFQIVYDAGINVGAVQSLLLREVKK